MSFIDAATVERMANLANIAFESAKLTEMTRDLDAIVAYVSRLPAGETASPDSRNLRLDDDTPRPFDAPLIAENRRDEGGSVVVPAIITKDT